MAQVVDHLGAVLLIAQSLHPFPGRDSKGYQEGKTFPLVLREWVWSRAPKPP